MVQAKTTSMLARFTYEGSWEDTQDIWDSETIPGNSDNDFPDDDLI